MLGRIGADIVPSADTSSINPITAAGSRLPARLRSARYPDNCVQIRSQPKIRPCSARGCITMLEDLGLRHRAVELCDNTALLKHEHSV